MHRRNKGYRRYTASSDWAPTYYDAGPPIAISFAPSPETYIDAPGDAMQWFAVWFILVGTVAALAISWYCATHMLSPVSITNPQDGDILVYKASQGVWVNRQPLLAI